jgi:hypothetical protein
MTQAQPATQPSLPPLVAEHQPPLPSFPPFVFASQPPPLVPEAAAQASPQPPPMVNDMQPLPRFAPTINSSGFQPQPQQSFAPNINSSEFRPDIPLYTAPRGNPPSLSQPMFKPTIVGAPPHPYPYPSGYSYTHEPALPSPSFYMPPTMSAGINTLRFPQPPAQSIRQPHDLGRKLPRGNRSGQP